MARSLRENQGLPSFSGREIDLGPGAYFYLCGSMSAGHILKG